MDGKSVKDYCVALNVAYMVNQFDGGQTWTLSHRASGTTWRGSFTWGEEANHFKAIRKWLDSLPWPTEDDPRVKMEGTFIERRFAS